MRGRGVWLRLIAISCLIGLAALTPALARGDGAGSGSSARTAQAIFHGRSVVPFGRSMAPRDNPFSGSIAAQGDQGSARAARQQTIVPAGIGPYSWFIGAGADEIYPVDNATSPDLHVVVIARLYPVPVAPPPNAVPDAIIGACHPISNGYHCDAGTADQPPCGDR